MPGDRVPHSHSDSSSHPTETAATHTPLRQSPPDSETEEPLPNGQRIYNVASDTINGVVEGW